MSRGRGGKRGRGGGGGNRGRGGNSNRSRGGGGSSDKPNYDNRQSFDQVPKQNEKFERYYNSLDLVPAGPEREAFWAALRRELPNAFRFCGSKGNALSVRKNLTERFFPMIEQIKHNGEPVELPKSMPWYPEGLAYSMTTPKNVVRKYEPFKEFQKFLVSETGVGNISRQEQVSMIPPLLLDVQPHHTVLDLCAAPGSKSAQLVELIHAGEEERVEMALKSVQNEETQTVDAGEEDEYGRSTGLLVANDVNYQRAQMLVHQVKRLNSPNLVVTNHDATMFPSIELPSNNPRQPKYLKFDRILADVPCSGDGTTRKNPNIWKDWSPQNALGLYITQVRILVRSLQMLKAGGRVVYSTCSLNPLENEAVVSSAIERCGGMQKIDIIDCSDQLPGLKRVPGRTDWSIMARSGSIYESWAEARQFEPAETSRIVPGMFPPEEGEKMPLERCIRVFPHQQDTGGFFITVLEKKSELKAKPEPESKCGSRDWVFREPQLTGEAAIMAELATNGGKSEEEHGLGLKSLEKLSEEQHADEKPVLDEATALIQGVPAEEVMANGKRKAEDELDADVEPKKPKVEIDVQPATNGHSTELGAATFSTTTNGDSATSIKPDNNALPTTSLPAPRPRRNQNDPIEESFKYLPPTHLELLSIAQFYALSPLFPTSRFLVRNPAGDPVKGIYYSSRLVRDILNANTNRGQGFKFVHAGVKMFMKQDVQGQEGVCRWRIQSEGLGILEGWVGESRVVRLWKRGTLRRLLVEMFPKVGGEDGQEGWRGLGEIGERVSQLSMGCCVLRVLSHKAALAAGLATEADDAKDGLEEGLTLPLWRSMHSLNLMLPKEERKAMLLRIFNEDVALINNTIKVDFPKREGPGAAAFNERNAKAAAARLGITDEAAGADVEEVQAEVEAERDVVENEAEGGVPVHADGEDAEMGDVAEGTST
nr:hypothetical protein B0A51_17063 [Rachicladosporium sp. CCFEE 5018]